MCKLQPIEHSWMIPPKRNFVLEESKYGPQILNRMNEDKKEKRSLAFSSVWQMIIKHVCIRQYTRLLQLEGYVICKDAFWVTLMKAEMETKSSWRTLKSSTPSCSHYKWNNQDTDVNIRKLLSIKPKKKVKSLPSDERAWKGELKSRSEKEV